MTVNIVIVMTTLTVEHVHTSTKKYNILPIQTTKICLTTSIVGKEAPDTLSRGYEGTMVGIKQTVQLVSLYNYNLTALRFKTCGRLHGGKRANSIAKATKNVELVHER